ncbi:MAG TPA: hypothetical protein VGK67_41000 [Myxococcales bacterium]|jgi:hypothetical protein
MRNWLPLTAAALWALSCSNPPPVLAPDAGSGFGPDAAMASADASSLAPDASAAGCTVNADCDVAAPICDPSFHTCRTCASAEDCADSGGVCNADGTCAASCTGCTSGGLCSPGNKKDQCGLGGGACAACSGATPTCRQGKCVGCATSADCSGTTPVCEAASKKCVACTDSASCGGGTCNADGSCTIECTGCVAGATCFPSPDSEHCGPAGGDCTTCASATPVCRYGACVGCASNSDCAAPTPLCNTGQWQCRSCQDLGCPGDGVCQADGSCASGCEGCFEGSVCQTIGDAHCGAAGGSCLACSGATPHCSSGACVACLTSDDCAGSPGKICRYGACVGCATNSDCAAPNPLCNTGQWQCRSCQDLGCPGSGACQPDGSCASSCTGCFDASNECQPVDAAHCGPVGGACTACVSAKPLCDQAGGVCAQCLSDADCGAGAAGSICRYGVCVGCATNSDCAAPKPICNTGQWQCIACTASTCGSQVCNANGTCSASCEGCLQNGICHPIDAAHCGAVGGACAACSGATPFCNTGACAACLTDTDCAGAPGKICRYGACVGCASNSDCASPTPLCNTGQWQCRSCQDLGCPGSGACQPDGSCTSSCNGCFAGGVCYPIDAAHCGPVGGTCTTCSGPTPLCDAASGTCAACLADADCASSAVGKICRYGTCVGCASNSDCAAPKPLCNTGQWQCIACTQSTCGSQVCNADGTCSASCNGCLQNGICYPVDASHCGPVGGACVGACTGGTSICSGGACVACVTNAECAGSAVGKICRYGTCVGCASNSDCSGTKPLCNSGQWQCIACTGSASCGGQVCNANGSCSATCNGCLQNGICYPVDASHCGPVGGACVGACGSAAPVCSGGACVQCVTNAECAGSAVGNICRYGVCVGCASNSDCAVPKPLCNSGQWQCIACTGSASCGGQVCNSNGSCSASCNGCYEGEVCYPISGAHCGVAGATCGLHCSGTTPQCHYGTSCVQCNSDSDCVSPKKCNPGPWICQ